MSGSVSRILNEYATALASNTASCMSSESLSASILAVLRCSTITVLASRAESDVKEVLRDLANDLSIGCHCTSRQRTLLALGRGNQLTSAAMP